MFIISDNPLYVLDGDGRQQLFDVDKLKLALVEAFTGAGNPDGYLAEDIALAVESAMADSARADRVFTQSEVDAAVSRILENAGCAGVAQTFRRANSQLYIAVDAREEEARKLVERHLGVTGAAAEGLARQVVRALRDLGFASAAPALYLELARHYERQSAHKIAVALPPAPTQGKFLMTVAEAARSLTGTARILADARIVTLANVSRLYPNFRLTLNLNRLAEHLELTPPVTELQLTAALYKAGDAAGGWLKLLRHQLGGVNLPLYLVLADLDLFTTRWLEAEYPAGKQAALEVAGPFRYALDYPVKKTSCRLAAPGDGWVDENRGGK